jgi:predicted nucleic acid-binding protein
MIASVRSIGLHCIPVKVYLDMCALKRPFDDQTQGRILIETLAVTRILDAGAAGALVLCNSAALEFENRQNPDAQRRERVATLLRWIGRQEPATARLLARAAEIVRRGFPDVDALHVAFAEHLKADYFVTVDDEILARSQQIQSPVKFLDAVEAVKELGL